MRYIRKHLEVWVKSQDGVVKKYNVQAEARLTNAKAQAESQKLLRQTVSHKYVEAIGRNPGEQYGKSHLYLEIESTIQTGVDYEPMCGYAWNRSDGEGFSIFRGHR